MRFQGCPILLNAATVAGQIGVWHRISSVWHRDVFSPVNINPTVKSHQEHSREHGGFLLASSAYTNLAIPRRRDAVSGTRIAIPTMAIGLHPLCIDGVDVSLCTGFCHSVLAP